MKKQLLLVALLSTAGTSLTHAEMTTQERAERLNQYNTMEYQGHTPQWLDYSSEENKDKMNIVKKHISEKADLKKRNITELAKTKNVDAYLDNMLSGSIALHKKQMQDWKDLSKAWFDKKSAQGQKEAGELAEFEGVEETGEETEE